MNGQKTNLLADICMRAVRDIEDFDELQPKLRDLALGHRDIPKEPESMQAEENTAFTAMTKGEEITSLLRLLEEAAGKLNGQTVHASAGEAAAAGSAAALLLGVAGSALYETLSETRSWENRTAAKRVNTEVRDTVRRIERQLRATEEQVFRELTTL